MTEWITDRLPENNHRVQMNLGFATVIGYLYVPKRSDPAKWEWKDAMGYIISKVNVLGWQETSTPVETGAAPNWDAVYARRYLEEEQRKRRTI